MSIKFDIPVLICLNEGGLFLRTRINGEQFKRWREDSSWCCNIEIAIYAGVLKVHVPIICTMNGFVYDKIVQRHGLPLLRERRVFTFDINEFPKL